jgi:putative hydrolase
MNKLIVDTHNHSISSGHAYSTVSEIAASAKTNGIKMFALTDHGPAMLGSCNYYHFSNLKVLPDTINDVRVLKGAELNIVDHNGTLDVPERYIKKLDFVNVSLHDVVIQPSSIENNTMAIINALKNPHVDAVAHPGNPVFPIDIDKVILAAKDLGKFIELNNQSFVSRRGSDVICKQILIRCKELNAKVVTGSDSHYCDHVGRFDNVIKLIEDVNMPDKLIMTNSIEKFESYLTERKLRKK